MTGCRWTAPSRVAEVRQRQTGPRLDAPAAKMGVAGTGCSVTDPFTGHLMAIGVDILRRLCTEWSRKGNDLITKQGKGCHMVLNETFEIQGQRVGGSPVQHELNDTADRLVLDVVAAVDDGYTGVPECHRLTAWLSAEFIPYVAPRFPQPPADLQELHAVLDDMHGANGVDAAQLSLRARSLIFRLL